MNTLERMADLFIAWTAVVGAIVLMVFRPDLDLKDVVIMAAMWSFGRGFSAMRNKPPTV